MNLTLRNRFYVDNHIAKRIIRWHDSIKVQSLCHKQQKIAINPAVKCTTKQKHHYQLHQEQQTQQQQQLQQNINHHTFSSIFNSRQNQFSRFFIIFTIFLVFLFEKIDCDQGKHPIIPIRLPS